MSTFRGKNWLTSSSFACIFFWTFDLVSWPINKVRKTASSCLSLTCIYSQNKGHSKDSDQNWKWIKDEFLDESERGVKYPARWPSINSQNSCCCQKGFSKEDQKTSTVEHFHQLNEKLELIKRKSDIWIDEMVKSLFWS